MKKRYLMLFFLCAILLCCVVVTDCYAESLDTDDAPAYGEEPTFVVSSVMSDKTESVEVAISFNNGERGICGATIRLSYDSALKLTNVRSGSAFSSLTLTKPGDYSTLTPTLLWDGMDADQSSGDIAILTFQAPEEEGVYNIIASCEEGDVIDGNLNDVDVVFISGSVTVMSASIEPDFILPAALASIEEEAFMGGGFAYVRLSENITYIGKRAFADCANLKHIYIPQAATTIEDDAFEGTNGLVIHGASGSLAETFAGAHGFAFQSE